MSRSQRSWEGDKVEVPAACGARYERVMRRRRGSESDEENGRIKGL